MKQKFLTVLLGASMATGALAQTVTVGSAGSGADYQTLTAALNGLMPFSTDGTPNEIVFLDEGPFYEYNRIVINVPRTGTDDLTIRGAEGVRPIIIPDVIGATGSQKQEAIHVRKQGKLTIRDLIIIPPSQNVVDPASYVERVASAGLQLHVVHDTGASSYFLHNILISSNDGDDRPVASLDGLTPPNITDETISFRDEGIYIPSKTMNPAIEEPHIIYMEDVVVSGLNGDEGSEGIRGFPDGAPGSKWIIGPGTTVSYCKLEEADVVTSASGHGAFQPGGTQNFSVEMRGSQDNPIRLINNNANGISISYDTAVPVDKNDTITFMEWVIIANNNGAGIRNQERDTNTVFQNVTIANNAGGIFWGPQGMNNVTYDFSNVIFAGNGNVSQETNIIDFLPHTLAPGADSFINIDNSAIVLNGPYRASGAGIEVGSNITLATSNISNTDPQFLSLDPTSPDFAVVSNSGYGTAGPGGQPLVGGGTFQSSSVTDWQLF